MKFALKVNQFVAGNTLCRFYSLLRSANSLIFCPSQGTQYPGMLGKDVLSNPLIELSKNVLEYDLADICKRGPKDKLTRTLYCQPAVLLATLLAYEKVQNENRTNLHTVVGYSLGEVTALSVAGYISYHDAFQLVKVRASAMDFASQQDPSGLVCVEGLTVNDIYTLCDELTVKSSCKGLFLAAELHETCMNVGGANKILNTLMGRKHRLLKDPSAVKLSKVNVSGAFHTPYMNSAQEKINNFLQSVTIYPKDVRLYSNVTGKFYENINSIKDLLVRQICEPVLLKSILQNVSEDFSTGLYDNIYELSRIKQMNSFSRNVNKKLANNIVNIPL